MAHPARALPFLGYGAVVRKLSGNYGSGGGLWGEKNRKFPETFRNRPSSENAVTEGGQIG